MRLLSCKKLSNRLHRASGVVLNGSKLPVELQQEILETAAGRPQSQKDEAGE